MFVRPALRAAIFSAIACLVAPSVTTLPANAKTVTFKATGAAIPINLPENWRVKTTERGLEIGSPDREATFWIEAIDFGTVESVVSGYFTFFRQQGVRMRQQLNQRKNVIGGVDVVLMEPPATWKGSPTVIRLLIADPRPGEKKGLFIGYWASPRADRVHDQVVTDIVADALRP